MLQKFSRKGWICKTYEGELAQYVVGGVAPQIWYFSTRDEKLAEKLSAAVGEQIRLHYTEHRGVPTTCFAETPYFAESFTRRETLGAERRDHDDDSGLRSAHARGQARRVARLPGQGRAGRQHREQVRLHAAVPGSRGAVSRSTTTAAWSCSAFRATSSARRSRAARTRSAPSASATTASAFRCSRRST